MMFRVHYRTPDEARRGIPERYFRTDDPDYAEDFQRLHPEYTVRLVSVPEPWGFSS
jgi:hypothetical protein